MGEFVTYTQFNETQEIIDARKAWLIAKESHGPLDKPALDALTAMLKLWLAHKGLPSDDASAKQWASHYAKQVMTQQLQATASLGAVDPDIVGFIGTDEVDEMILKNSGKCTRCQQPVFWARVVKRDKTSGNRAPFDIEPIMGGGNFKMTVRGGGDETHLAAHKWGPEKDDARYNIHFDTCTAQEA